GVLTGARALLQRLQAGVVPHPDGLRLHRGWAAFGLGPARAPTQGAEDGSHGHRGCRPANKFAAIPSTKLGHPANELAATHSTKLGRPANEFAASNSTESTFVDWNGLPGSLRRETWCCP